MPKKFKVKTYEKDNDDHYVVVLNPWAKGYKHRCQEQADWIGAWLRIVFGKPQEKHIVKNIYTVDTRSEIIARISASVDVRLGLGLHRWEEIMAEGQLRKIKQHSGVDLSENVSYIFPYNWTLHGDPAERQWQEWFPRQDRIPPSIMIKMDYPEPEWTEIPPVDGRLRSLLLPLPAVALDDDLSMTEDSVLDGAASNPSTKENGPSRFLPKREDVKQPQDGRVNTSSYHDPLKFPERPHSDKDLPKAVCSSGKADKLDPYEEDDKARALLTSVPVKQEVAEGMAILAAIPISSNPLKGVKSEAEDVKANIRDTDYRPSDALSSALSQLRKGQSSREADRRPIIKREEGMDVKPDIQSTEYRPSNGLTRAFSQLRDSIIHSEEEDQRPAIKKRRLQPN